MKKTLLALALFTCLNIRATSLTVDFYQDQWYIFLSITPIGVSEAALGSGLSYTEFFIDGTSVGSGGQHTISGIMPADLLPDYIFGVGTHTPTYAYTVDGNEFVLTGTSYTVTLPTVDRDTFVAPVSTPDGGSTAVLFGISALCIALVHRFRP